MQNIINKSSFTILFGLYFKAFKKLIINSYDDGIYRRTKIFSFIKITRKPLRLQINTLHHRLDYLEMLNKKIYKKLKKIEFNINAKDY